MKCKEPKYAFLQSQHLLFKDSPKIILCKNESQIYDMYGVSPPCRFKFLPRNMTKTEFYNTVNNIKRGKDIDTFLLSLPLYQLIFSFLGMRNCVAEVIKSTTRGRSLWFDWCNHFFILMIIEVLTNQCQIIGKSTNKFLKVSLKCSTIVIITFQINI